MTVEHIDAVHEIETSSFAFPWSKNQLLEEVTTNKHAIYKVAIIDTVVVGHAGMWHIINEGHITNIATKTPYRNMGIGSLLVEALIEEAKKLEMIGLTLEVRTSNIAAQNLYNKYGFKPEGIRKRYYADTGEDAVIMWNYF